MLGKIGAIWATLGIVVFLGSAIVRLGLMGSQLELMEIDKVQWGVLVLWVVFMAYFEGYKGFQKSFSPRVAARIYFLTHNVTWLRLLFAPVFCLGFFDGQRRKVIFVWMLTVGVFILIQLMNYVPMPWRGIVDVGVVVGLSWGLISILAHTYKVFTNYSSYYNPCMPE